MEIKMGQNPNQKTRKVLVSGEEQELLAGYRSQLKSQIDDTETDTEYGDPAKGNKRKIGVMAGGTYEAPVIDEESVRQMVRVIIEEMLSE